MGEEAVRRIPERYANRPVDAFLNQLNTLASE